MLKLPEVFGILFKYLFMSIYYNTVNFIFLILLLWQYGPNKQYIGLHGWNKKILLKKLLLKTEWQYFI